MSCHLVRKSWVEAFQKRLLGYRPAGFSEMDTVMEWQKLADIHIPVRRPWEVSDSVSNARPPAGVAKVSL